MVNKYFNFSVSALFPAALPVKSTIIVISHICGWIKASEISTSGVAELFHFPARENLSSNVELLRGSSRNSVE